MSKEADAVQFVGGGLKCDNPECDFVDMSIEVSDYKNWINKPCPKCGSNLLTQEDYDATMMIMNLVNKVNKQYGKVPQETVNAKLTFNFDGSGIPQINIEDYNNY